MKYFVSEAERKASHSSCYFEFQQGLHHDQCWLPDSISIHESLWNEFDLSSLFGRVIQDFDYFGITVVSKAQWNEIIQISQDPHPAWYEIIAEAAPWVEECFLNHEVFSIMGM